MPIHLEAIHPHPSYTNGVPVWHAPGERYDLVDGASDITADMVANAFEAAGLAKRVDAVPVKAKKAKA